jgi:acyl carrier protein
VLPTTDRDAIRRFICARFGNAIRGELKETDPLFSSGIVDSFGVLELIAFLEDQFVITVDPARHDLSEFDTIDSIADVVARVRGANG